MAAATFPAETAAEATGDRRLSTDGELWWLCRSNGWRCCRAGHVTPEEAVQCGGGKLLRGPRPAIVETRADHEVAAEMLRQGHTMREVGRTIGCTGERIRQLVAKGRLPKPIRTIEGGKRIEGLVRRGLVEPLPSGRFSVAEIRAVLEQLPHRPCGWPGCESEIGNSFLGSRFCAVHSRENLRYSYPADTPEQRRRHQRATKRWAARQKQADPERFYTRQRRANLVWRLVKSGMDRAEARRIALERYPDPAP